MKPSRLLVLLLIIGFFFVMPVFAGQKDAPSKTKSLSKEAQGWLEQAKKGDATAQYNLGVRYDIGQGVPQDHVEAAKWYRKAAEQGDAYSQYTLGVMYHEGVGVPQDYVEAAKWLRKSAEQENDFAQHILATMCDEGKGVPKDYVEAARWYRKVAEQGNAHAQYKLGDMYASGRGVTEDYVEAYKWYNLAAAGYTNTHYILPAAKLAAAVSEDKLRHDECVKLLDSVAAKMTPAQIDEAQKRASEWKPTK